MKRWGLFFHPRHSLSLVTWSVVCVRNNGVPVLSLWQNWHISTHFIGFLGPAILHGQVNLLKDEVFVACEPCQCTSEAELPWWQAFKCGHMGEASWYQNGPGEAERLPRVMRHINDCSVKLLSNRWFVKYYQLPTGRFRGGYNIWTVLWKMNRNFFFSFLMIFVSLQNEFIKLILCFCPIVVVEASWLTTQDHLK